MVKLALLSLLLAGAAQAEDAVVRRIERQTATWYGYATAPVRTGVVTRAESWLIERGDGSGMVLTNLSLPPTASTAAKRSTALAATRAALGNGNATLRVQP